MPLLFSSLVQAHPYGWSQDYYTRATFGNANATSEYLLMKILVNTIVIGNYTATPTDIVVPGILANATVHGKAVSLLEYFDGSVNTTNVGDFPTAMNFLDAGGAAPMTKNMVNTTLSHFLCICLLESEELCTNLHFLQVLVLAGHKRDRYIFQGHILEVKKIFRILHVI